MLKSILYRLAFSLDALENVNWTAVIIIAAVGSVVVAFIIALLQMKKKYIDTVSYTHLTLPTTLTV